MQCGRGYVAAKRQVLTTLDLEPHGADAQQYEPAETKKHPVQQRRRGGGSVAQPIEAFRSRATQRSPQLLWPPRAVG